MTSENEQLPEAIETETSPEQEVVAPVSVENAPASEPTPAPTAGGAPDARGRNDRGARRGGDDKRGGGKRTNRRRGEEGEKEFQEEVLEVARVTRVVKGGRRLRFRATVIIGNKKGKVGLGTGKSVEVSVAVQKAVASAKKSLILVPIENGTVPHEVNWKHKSARILLMPAKSGTGIIAGGAMRKIANLAGIENLHGKSYGTNNPLVNAQAMMEALQTFRKLKRGMHPSETPVVSAVAEGEEAEVN